MRAEGGESRLEWPGLFGGNRCSTLFRRSESAKKFFLSPDTVSNSSGEERTYLLASRAVPRCAWRNNPTRRFISMENVFSISRIKKLLIIIKNYIDYIYSRDD